MSAYGTSMKARYAAFIKRAAEMKRSRAADVAAMKARYSASLRGPTLVKVYTPPSDPTAQILPQERESEPTNLNLADLHDDKRRKTSPTTYARISKDAADLEDMETDKIANAFANMSVKPETKVPRKTRIISATFDFQTSAYNKMANAIANMSSMSGNKAESGGHDFSPQSQPVVRV